MSLVEGGQFICSSTGFATPSIEGWNKHCLEDCHIHTEEGSTICISCGESIQFSGIPFHKVTASGSKNIALRCDDCQSKTVGAGKVSKMSKNGGA